MGVAATTIALVATAAMATALLLLLVHRFTVQPPPHCCRMRLEHAQRCFAVIVRHLTRTECCALSDTEKARLLLNYARSTITATRNSASYLAGKRDVHVSLTLPCGSFKPLADVTHELVHMASHMAHAGIGHATAFWDIKRRAMQEVGADPLVLMLIDVHAIARFNAARLIQRAWRRAVCDPRYAACRRRLVRELDELVRELDKLNGVQ